MTTPQNALDALDRLYNLELAYEERRALYEAVRTALKQSSAEVVTVDGMMEEEKREEEINNGQFGVGA